MNHLYTWIDNIIKKYRRITSVVVLPPKETQDIIDSIPKNQRTILDEYDPFAKKTTMVALDGNEVVYAQMASTTKGFDSTIQESFDKGKIIEQPIAH